MKRPSSPTIPSVFLAGLYAGVITGGPRVVAGIALAFTLLFIALGVRAERKGSG